MRILIVDRDLEEMSGIEWYLKNYLPYDIHVQMLQEKSLLQQQLDSFSPNLLIIEMKLVTAATEKIISTYQIPIIAITAEPIFNQALKAVRIQALNLLVKPIPLEELKSTILTIPINRQPIAPQIYNESHIYSDLFFDTPKIYNLDSKAFFLMECANFDDNLRLYTWLNQLPIFEGSTSLPLQKRIICLVQSKNPLQLNSQLRIIMQEWERLTGEVLNIALFDGKETTMLNMYNACKKTLSLRFYNGYSHIFKSSQKLQFTPLDPLLSFEEQQLWVTSLDKGDIQQIKTLLYRLTTSTIHYHQEDVRIHLTSILAQIRRYMKKYQLQDVAKIEEQYRELFHYILEHPVLYTIIQELILFTQSITIYVKQTLIHELADYTELAVAIVEREYKNAELSLRFVALELSITPNYLSSIFSKARGIPFKKFVQQFRLHQAAELIVTTNDSIASIAEAVGFIDSNYFSKVFREYYKTTPYRYRLQKKKTSHL